MEKRSLCEYLSKYVNPTNRVTNIILKYQLLGRYFNYCSECQMKAGSSAMIEHALGLLGFRANVTVTNHDGNEIYVFPGLQWKKP